MATPDQGGESPITPLDDERAKLRAKGWSEEKIEQILFEREVGRTSPQPPNAAASGPIIQGPPMSGVLGNANAVLGHVRAAIPVMTSATENLANSAAPTKSRFRSAIVLAGIGLIVCVLAFGIWQEWQQHIVYETEIKRLNAQIASINIELTKAQNEKAQAEAAVAREVAAGHVAQAEKAKAEAEVAKQVAAGQVAQAEKAKAEAEVAKQVAAGQVAQAEKAKAEAEVAKQVAAGQVAQAEKAKAEAAVAPEVAAGQAADARKKEAEAQYAEELAKGQKAQACSQRMEMLTKTLSLDDLATGSGMDEYNKDCNPKYAGCNAEFKDLLASIKDATFSGVDSVDAKLTSYKARCPYGKSERDQTVAVWKNSKVGAAIERLHPMKITPDASASTTPEPTPTPTPSYSALATPEPTPTPTPSASALANSPPQPKTPTLYENYDFVGNDLEHVASNSIETCLSACSGNSQCQGVTFDKWNNTCFLKSQATTLWFDPHGIAASVDPTAKPVHSDAPMYMTHYAGKGFHRTGEMSYAANAASCERTCKQTDWCAAESFFKSDSLCMMLRTTDAYISNGDAESSIKRQKKYEKNANMTIFDFLRNDK